MGSEEIVDWVTQYSDDDPYSNFKYSVQIDGTAIGGFTKISGIGLGSELMEYREGGLNTVTHKFPKHLSASNVELHRGFTHYDKFVSWMIEAMNSPADAAQHDIEITMQSSDGSSVWGWELKGAYPVRWEGPDLAEGGGIALELVELSYEQLTIIRYSKS